MNVKVRIAFAKTGLTQEAIAKAIGKSQTLVSMMFAGKHKGWAHREEILRMLGLTKKAEAEVFNDRPEKTKPRRAA